MSVQRGMRKWGSNVREIYSTSRTKPSVCTTVDSAIARSLLIVIFTTSIVLGTDAIAQDSGSLCGSLENPFGPFDYTDPENARVQSGGGESPLSLVERAHFTTDVENLIRGASSFDPITDLEYTLRAFPNHHRALNAIANYYLKDRESFESEFSIECWFDRAMRFRPGDPLIRVVYGVFLAKQKKNLESLEQYEEALAMRHDLPEAHYNIGLLYSELEEYELAYQHAIQAYALGYPLPGLRNRLQRVGAWKAIEPE